MWIFLILIAVPIIEIGLFIELGGWVGLWPTLGLVVLTAILGGVLLRMQGFAAMARLQSSMAEGGDPVGPLAHGFMILVAGLLMLTPGFFTDAIGFSLLILPVRAGLIKWIGPKLAARAVHVDPNGAQRPQTRYDAGEDPIEADYIDLDDIDDSSRPKGTSGWSRPPNSSE